MKRHYCRKCGRYSPTLNETNPICGACGYFGLVAVDYDHNQERASVGKREVFVLKKKLRRCRDCNKVLGLNRYFHCSECVKPSDMPSADPFDIFSAYEYATATMDTLDAPRPPEAWRSRKESKYV